MSVSDLNIQKNVSLKPYTTFGVGGRAKYFVTVLNSEELVLAIKFAKKNKIRFHILAGGSNVVFADGLLDILLIKLELPKIFSSSGKIFGESENFLRQDGERIICEGQVCLMDLINFSIKNGLSGLETLSGIPGTVAGAIVGNAAAYGQTISDPLVRVQIFDGKKTHWLKKRECGFSYRHSLLKKKPWFVLRAEFAFNAGDRKELIKKSKEIIKLRLKKYPEGMMCPGSFFKNILLENIPKKSRHLIPENRDWYGKVPAWFFLNEVGARGMKRGGVYIPDYHGNLLVNDGTAKFKDIKSLADELKTRVKKRFNIVLEEEIKYIE